MANVKYANNAVTTLASGITAVATSMTVASAAAFPTLGAGEYFYCTLTDTLTSLVIEIVKVTAVSGTTFTITRAQDGTTASAYILGDNVQLRLTRANLLDFPLLDEVNTFTANLGIGATPSAWASPVSGSVIEGYLGSAIYSNSASPITYISSNGFFNGTNYTYKTTAPIAHYQIQGAAGIHVWSNAVSGTAGTTTALTERMRLDANGLLGLNITPSYGLHVYSAAGNGQLCLQSGLASQTTMLIRQGVPAIGNGGMTIYDVTNSASRLVIGATGGVSIGNTTDPGATNLSVTGTTTSTGGIVSTSIGATGPSTGAFTTLGASSTVTLSPASANVAISPTGTGTVTISPAGALTINPTAASTINNASIGATTASTGRFAGITATAGTTTVPPIQLTSGTNLTSATAGAIEYDGVNFYATTDTTNGRNVVPEYQQFYLSSNVTAFGPSSGDFFGATSSASLAATTSYDIECYCYFLKSTSGTAQWIPTFSTALTVGHCYLEYTPVTGFTTTVITGAMVTAEATQQTTTVLTTTATSSLTTAVSHIAKLKIRVLTNTACNFRLKFVGSAGTITPQAGSWYTVRKIASSAGNFVA